MMLYLFAFAKAPPPTTERTQPPTTTAPEVTEIEDVVTKLITPPTKTTTEGSVNPPSKKKIKDGNPNLPKKLHLFIP